MNKFFLRAIILTIFISLSFFPFSSAQSASITTLFAADNGGAPGGGIYFDIENVGTFPIIITSWDVNVDGTHDIEVWYRAGTYQGFEQTTTDWQLLGTDIGVVSQGVDQPTPVNIGGLTINPGQVFGIGMAGGTQWNYTNGTGGNQIYNDGILEIRTGSANNVAFSAGLFTPRVWNGTINYDLSAPTIPTLSEWGMIVLSLLLGGIAVCYMRRNVYGVSTA